MSPKPQLFDAGNKSRRVPAIIVPDSSLSMIGNPIAALNRGFAEFKQEAEADERARLSVDISVIAFGGKVHVVQDFCPIEQFTPPTLVAAGNTPMGAALCHAMDRLQERKHEYNVNGIVFYCPWIFLITDGAPTDDWQQAARRVHEGELQEKFLFFAIGVQGADINILSQIAPPNRRPMLLKGLAFRELFRWIEISFSRVSASAPGEQVPLPEHSGWGVIAPSH